MQIVDALIILILLCSLASIQNNPPNKRIFRMNIVQIVIFFSTAAIGLILKYKHLL